MSLNKIVYFVVINLFIVTICFGAGWREAIGLEHHPMSFRRYPPALAVDDSGIHSGTVSDCKSNVVLYLRSLDHGVTWNTRAFCKYPNETFETVDWTYIVSDPPYLHCFARENQLFVMNSEDGGTTWTPWITPSPNASPYCAPTYIPASPEITSCASNGELYLFWADVGIIQKFFIKSQVMVETLGILMIQFQQTLSD